LLWESIAYLCLGCGCPLHGTFSFLVHLSTPFAFWTVSCLLRTRPHSLVTFLKVPSTFLLPTDTLCSNIFQLLRLPPFLISSNFIPRALLCKWVFDFWSWMSLKSRALCCCQILWFVLFCSLGSYLLRIAPLYWSVTFFKFTVRKVLRFPLVFLFYSEQGWDSPWWVFYVGIFLLN